MEKIFAKIKNFIIGPYPYEKNMTLYVLKRIVWLGTLIASIRYWFLLNLLYVYRSGNRPALPVVSSHCCHSPVHFSK